MEDLGLGWLKHTRCLHCAQMTGQPPMEFINFVMLYDVVCSHVLFQGAAPAAQKNVDDMGKLRIKRQLIFHWKMASHRKIYVYVYIYISDYMYIYIYNYICI